MLITQLRVNFYVGCFQLLLNEILPRKGTYTITVMFDVFERNALPTFYTISFNILGVCDAYIIRFCMERDIPVNAFTTTNMHYTTLQRIHALP